MDVAVLWGIIVLSLLIIAGAGMFVRCIERLTEDNAEYSEIEARISKIESRLYQLEPKRNIDDWEWAKLGDIARTGPYRQHSESDRPE